MLKCEFISKIPECRLCSTSNKYLTNKIELILAINYNKIHYHSHKNLALVTTISLTFEKYPSFAFFLINMINIQLSI